MMNIIPEACRVLNSYIYVIISIANCFQLSLSYKFSADVIGNNVTTISILLWMYTETCTHVFP